MSFATIEFYEAQQVLVHSAREHVDGFIWYRERDLPRDFRRRNHQLFRDQRGFGYFVWKPWVILDALAKIDDGDLLLYVDSGNTITSDPAPLFELCAASHLGIVVFDNRDWCPGGNVWKNSMFTRGDCFERMHATGPEFIGGDQVNASYLVVQKRPAALDFLTEFLHACEDYQIVSDVPNVLRENEPDFLDHRHDQSVLSILAIKHGIPFERDPSQFGNHLINIKGTFPQIFDHNRHRRTYSRLTRAWLAGQGLLRAALRRIARVEKGVTWIAPRSDDADDA